MNYFYTDSSNQVIGPVTDGELHVLYSKGAVMRNTSIVEQGREDWQKYSTVFGSDGLNMPKASPLKQSYATQAKRPRPASSELFLQSRYKDAYRTADFIIGLATFIKVFGGILAFVILAYGFITMEHTEGKDRPLLICFANAAGIFFIFFCVGCLDSGLWAYFTSNDRHGGEYDPL